MIYIKTKKQIEGIKKACEIWQKVKTLLKPLVKPGVTTLYLDEQAGLIIRSLDSTPTFLNLYNFPRNICICVNHQIIHGLASDYIIKENDLISFDMGVTHKEFICDSVFNVIVYPNNKIEAQKILEASNICLAKAIEEVYPGNHIGNISNIIEKTAKNLGYVVIRKYAGHGCGIKVHEDPLILNYGEKNTGTILKEGMIICIEPMLLINNYDITTIGKDVWTMCSKNKELTCHTESMILVTKDGHEVLTDDYSKID